MKNLLVHVLTLLPLVACASLQTGKKDSIIDMPNRNIASACLTNASDSEILHELATRLNSGESGNTKIIMNFTCSSKSEFIASSTTSTGSVLDNIYLATDGFASCQKYINTLNEKIGNRIISGDLIFAVCVRNTELNRILIQPNGMLRMLQTTLGTSLKECRNSADQINNMLGQYTPIAR